MSGCLQEERALIEDVERRLAEKYKSLPVDQVATVVRHAYACAVPVAAGSGDSSPCWCSGGRTRKSSRS